MLPYVRYRTYSNERPSRCTCANRELLGTLFASEQRMPCRRERIVRMMECSQSRLRFGANRIRECSRFFIVNPNGIQGLLPDHGGGA